MASYQDIGKFDFKRYQRIQCTLDLVTLNLVGTYDLVTILHRPFFNLLHMIIRFSDNMQFSDSFCRPNVSLNQDCTVLSNASLLGRSLLDFCITKLETLQPLLPLCHELMRLRGLCLVL